VPDDSVRTDVSREKLVSVRFAADELERLKRAADQEGLSISAYVRRAVLGTETQRQPTVSSRSNNMGSTVSLVGGYGPGAPTDAIVTGKPVAVTSRYGGVAAT
jgi:hypothetical protein